MSWAYRVARVAGIDVKVHATFAIIVLLAAASWSNYGPAGMAFGAILILLLFACVTLHEFGHAVAAQRYGIPVREIVLLPIGGVAFLGRQTRHPVQELVIAAAGPAVNVVLIAFLAQGLYLLGESVSLRPTGLGPTDAGPSVVTAMHWLLSANVGLVLFNLIPAFPLDGGRMLRGLLGLRMEWSQATRWAATTGQALAMGLGAFGLMQGHVMLAIIATMIFFSAAAAGADERGHSVLSAQRVGDACNRNAATLAESDRVSTVVALLLTSYQPDFAVMRGPRLLGVVRRSQVLDALVRRLGDLPVAAIMTDCPRVRADRSLVDTRDTFAATSASVAAVFQDDVFLGLVSAEDIAEAEMVLAFAAAGRESTRRTGPVPRDEAIAEA
ncbi:MAG: site-2 protease family protein [Acidobacteria bacterium]|nr:site-2 protease family protein [Acidobacteriota bacterium]